MPSGKHQVEVNQSIESVWKFVSDINNWAPLVPGYMEHEIISEKQLTWKFVSDIGIMKRTLHMKVDIIEWEEPTKVTFLLQGINEKFDGNGYFEAHKLNQNKTTITGFLDITAQGMLGPAINPVLHRIIPETAKDLTDAIAIHLNGEISN